MNSLLKFSQSILIGLFIIFSLSACTKEYACRCTGTDINGVETLTVTTVDSKSKSAAEIACENTSVDINYVSLECTVL